MHQVEAHEETRDRFVQISNDYGFYQIQQTASMVMLMKNECMNRSIRRSSCKGPIIFVAI